MRSAAAAAVAAEAEEGAGKASAGGTGKKGGKGSKAESKAKSKAGVGKKAAVDDGIDDAREKAAARTVSEVIAEGTHTHEVDTALFTVPVPIVAHQSNLKAIFPAANRPEQPQSPRLLSRAIFPSGRDGTSASEMQVFVVCCVALRCVALRCIGTVMRRPLSDLHVTPPTVSAIGFPPAAVPLPACERHGAAT